MTCMAKYLYSQYIQNIHNIYNIHVHGANGLIRNLSYGPHCYTQQIAIFGVIMLYMYMYMHTIHIWCYNVVHVTLSIFGVMSTCSVIVREGDT